MAESIISPGVYTRENDISFIQPAPIAAGAAFIGPAVKGPIEQPTIVTSYNDYVRKFGAVFQSGSDNHEFFTSMAVRNYFGQGGQTALITRVVSGSYTQATSTKIGSDVDEVAGKFSTASINISSWTNTETGSYETIAIVDPNHNYYYLTSVAWGTGNDYNQYNAQTDQGYFSPGAGEGYTKAQWTASFANMVNNLATEIGLTVVTGTANLLQFTGSVALEGLRIFTDLGYGQATGSATPAAILGGGEASVSSNVFTLKTIGEGALYNNSTAATDAGLHLADGSLASGSVDNLRWEVANVNDDLGTFSLLVRRGDDNTGNKVILETFNNLSLDPNSDNYIERVIGNQTLSFDGSVNRLSGEYPNRSNYIVVDSVSLPTINYLANDGLTVNVDASGVSYSASLPIVSSGSFYGATGAVKNGANLYHNISTQTQGLVAENYSNAITLLENKDEYQFNVIAAPGLTNASHGTVVDSIVSLAETRGDCIAVVDLTNHNATLSTATTQAADLNTSYAASYWPWLQVQSAANKTVWVPASVVIPGVYAFTDAATAPWFAPAGLVRGGISGVIQTELKLTKAQRDTLYAAKVNPIATFPGTGISVFGQKTLQTKASALDRVNVRRLLIELKKFIGDQARNLVFEQNTIATRNRFLATVNPYLESVVQRQGLYAYRVVMDDSNNTADVIDRNQLVGQIFIQPAKTIEFVVLDFTVEPTGATFA